MRDTSGYWHPLALDNVYETCTSGLARARYEREIPSTWLGDTFTAQRDIVAIQVG